MLILAWAGVRGDGARFPEAPGIPGQDAARRSRGPPPPTSLLASCQRQMSEKGLVPKNIYYANAHA